MSVILVDDTRTRRSRTDYGKEGRIIGARVDHAEVNKVNYFFRPLSGAGGEGRMWWRVVKCVSVGACVILVDAWATTG